MTNQSDVAASPPQIVPGSYKVFQEPIPNEGNWKEVGTLEVEDRGGGARVETWYLYLETKDSRYKFTPWGARDDKDNLQLQLQKVKQGQPTGIRSSKIVASCPAPQVVGP